MEGRKYLLPCGGNFYKANLHTHTNLSDGAFSPEAVKDAYKKNGYSILAYTDHECFVPHNDLTDDSFLAINGVELSINKPNPIMDDDFAFVKTYHVNLYAKSNKATTSPVITPERVLKFTGSKYVPKEQLDYAKVYGYSVEEINEIIAVAKQNGFFVSYNHPVWSLQNYADYADLKGVFGVEWYNTGSEIYGNHDTEQPITDLHEKGEFVFPLATDDSHLECDRFGGFVMVKAEKLDYDTVVGALLRGDFYSSSGPLIHDLYLEGNTLMIKCSGVSSVNVIMSSRRDVEKAGENLTDIEIDVAKQISLMKKQYEKGVPAYFRIVLTDKNGKKALTRAYLYSELI